MAIYTRTGDKGKTSLMGGRRVLKSDQRVEAYGTIDELNSAIGVVLAETRNTKYEIRKISQELKKIQNDLLDIGSALATPEGAPLEHLEERPKDFEKLIDQLTEKLPPLSQFILPGGGKGGAHLHLARTICRRAERRVVALLETAEVDQAVLVYLNRLSDLLFTMSRFVNHIEKHKELIWRKK